MATYVDTQRQAPNERHDLAAAKVGFAVVDVETTGLHAGHDMIVEIAVITADIHGELIDLWHSLVDPGCGIPYDATEVHGIDECDVVGAPTIKELAGQLLARLSGRVLVCHKVAFDGAFLDVELFGPSGWPGPSQSICTLTAARSRLRRGSRRLGACATTLNVPDHRGSAHTALGDALKTWGLMRRMWWRGWLGDVDLLLQQAALTPCLDLDHDPAPSTWPRACPGITDDDGLVSFDRLLALADLPAERWT